MPNPQEIDQETREALARLGFEHEPGSDVAFVRLLRHSALYIWFPGAIDYAPDHWVADKALSYIDLQNGAGVLFDDPISAAVWLNVEASHG